MPCRSVCPLCVSIVVGFGSGHSRAGYLVRSNDESEHGGERRSCPCSSCCLPCSAEDGAFQW